MQVAIDLLIERGDHVGERHAEGLPLTEPLESAVSLELEWRRGFVHAARLRAQPFRTVRELLFALLRSEASRFLGPGVFGHDALQLSGPCELELSCMRLTARLRAALTRTLRSVRSC